MDPARPPEPHGSLRLAGGEGDIVGLALVIASQQGDADPELIQHTVGTRQAATKTTGSWVDDEEPSYLVAMRGDFIARRSSPPSLPGSRESDATVSYPVQVLVIAIGSGRITDSGGGPVYPDLAAVGPVVTDYRDGERIAPERDVKLALDAHRRQVTAAAAAARAARAPIALSFRGSVTLGSPGRARLHDRPGGLSDFIWQALSDAGWMGRIARLHPLIELSVSVPRATALTAPAVLRPLDGGPRSLRERGRSTDDGRVHQGYGGPLNAKAIKGLRLTDSERRPDDYDSFEDMLYTAAFHAGWLAPNHTSHADLPDVEIVIRVPRYSD